MNIKKSKLTWLVMGLILGGIAMVMLQSFGVTKPSLNKIKASGAGVCIDACERAYNHCALYVSKQALLEGGPDDLEYCNRQSDACDSGCEGYN